jgi:tetratricopeptide (TPR) repeat protein
MMDFTVIALLLSLCLSLILGIGGCSNRGFHDERQGKVITDTTAILERSPYDAELYVTRGTAYYCIREYEKALSDFNRAIEIDSKNAAAYRLRGMTSVNVDYQALPDDPDIVITSHFYKGKRADTDKAYLLDPGILDEAINRGFGYFSKNSNEFIYPVAGDCVAKSNLILGSTTTRQVEHMFPPPRFPGIGSAMLHARNPTKPRIGKVGKVVDNARYYFEPDYDHTYDETNPSVTLVFDMNNTLVVISSLDSMTTNYHYDDYLGKTGSERILRIGRMRLEKYHDLMRQNQFTEVYRDKEYPSKKTLRAEITPCVTVDIEVPIEPEPEAAYVLYGVDYIYTCQTNRD